MTRIQSEAMRDLQQLLRYVGGIVTVFAILTAGYIINDKPTVQIIILLLLLAMGVAFMYRIWATLRDARKRFGTIE